MENRLARHYLNSLHVMARLFRWGLPLASALAIARTWERIAHSHLYRH